MLFRNIKRERRKEKRNYCSWPIWFAANRSNRFFYGDIIDYSSDSLSLICKSGTVALHPGCMIKIYFGYSNSTLKKSHGVEMFSCEGNIYRVDNLGRQFLHRNSRIAVRLDRQLPFAACRIKALKVIFEVMEEPNSNKQEQLCSAGISTESD
ncbi:MAG: hypothetical protein JW806_03350 [Sedimentisphaerales bacterium]|nr:hypothetical protein [Sedimentisphaerales bacterium]